MSWLFANKTDSSWSLLGVDDGCDGLDKASGEQRECSGDMMKKIAETEGFKNVSVFFLKEGIKAGDTGKVGLDDEKLKSEGWKDDDKLVKASQKAGAILFGLSKAVEEGCLVTPYSKYLMI